MEAYKIQETIGEGSFAVVLKATHIKTGETVAMKKIKRKFNSWDECMSLRELKSLRKLNHENIIKLKEALKVKDDLYFVFEYMEQNVYQLYNQLRDTGKSFTENQIRDIVHQTASGLAYMHKHGFFHRDLKPENLLINKGVTKIADFGLAREIRSRPPYTDYVATRWYRAPEILLKSTNYNSPVDIFALGCIMAELYLMAPLFKGNTEMEQMFKICSILGTPTQTTWNEGLRLAAQVGFSFPADLPTVNLATIIPNASEEAIQLITEMLRFDPQKRPSAQQVLQHPYFANFTPNEKPLLLQVPGFDKALNSRSTKNEQNLSARGKENNLSARGYDNNDRLEILDDHLELLDNLEFQQGESDYSSRKMEKKVSTKEIKPLDEDNTDDLLAEIEGYINSDTSKTDTFGKGSLSTNKGYSLTNKPTLTSVQSGNIKPSLGYNDSMGRMYDMGSDMPMYDSLTKKNNDVLDSYYNKPDKYSMGDNMYNKYGTNKATPQFSVKAPNSVSNREAQIMNTFVYTSNNKPAPNPINDSWSNPNPRAGQFEEVRNYPMFDRLDKTDW